MVKVQLQEEEFINPNIEVFISYFENPNIDSEFDIYEKYTSENYGNIDRTTIRAMASALGIGHSQVYRMIKYGNIRAYTNSIKPKLSHGHKIRRINFIISQIIPPTVDNIPKFSLMYNVVHIDEKWFYMSRETQRYYLFPWEEEESYRCVQNKNFIGKVMFIAAVARLQISSTGEVLWDGKIEKFSFTKIYYAMRRLENRLADNAKPYILTNDHAFNEEAKKDGFNIRLVCPPASSPNMNILDLGLFSALQSIQFKSFPKDLNDLIKAVNDAYDTFEPKLLTYTWIQYQLCMIEVLKAKGGNNYKNADIGKQRLDRLGMLPRQLEIPQELIDAARQFLSHGIINLNDLPQDD
ncbi:uncharacterized protein LOC130824826 [Amaranthus tricolor]|uniref:uncharacterized protein LOC130824826 n=1 Tax=Amaranthus tricolor TaxID=29722 RepID=UPI00258A9170|nr:uncharacterized protein LOC130824826 [Amaranthus tricolor]